MKKGVTWNHPFSMNLSLWLMSLFHISIVLNYLLVHYIASILYGTNARTKWNEGERLMERELSPNDAKRIKSFELIKRACSTNIGGYGVSP